MKYRIKLTRISTTEQLGDSFTRGQPKSGFELERLGKILMRL